jgi:hypothetical protein
MENNPNPLFIEHDLAVPKPARRLKPIAIVLGAVALVGFTIFLATGSHAAPKADETASVAPPALAVTPPSTPTPPVAPAPVAKPDPAIAAAVTPHDEEVTTPPAPKQVSAKEHIQLARKLEREAQRNRRLAAAEYRKEAAKYARTAAADRRKAASNARMARSFQRLALRSLRRTG